MVAAGWHVQLDFLEKALDGKRVERYSRRLPVQAGAGSG